MWINNDQFPKYLRGKWSLLLTSGLFLASLIFVSFLAYYNRIKHSIILHQLRSDCLCFQIIILVDTKSILYLMMIITRKTLNIKFEKVTENIVKNAIKLKT